MINWAILGTGFISRTVADAINNSDGSRLAAVAGRSAAGVTAFAEEYDIPKAYADFGEALADDQIDAVYIGLPQSCASADGPCGGGSPERRSCLKSR